MAMAGSCSGTAGDSTAAAAATVALAGAVSGGGSGSGSGSCLLKPELLAFTATDALTPPRAAFLLRLFLADQRKQDLQLLEAAPPEEGGGGGGGRSLMPYARDADDVDADADDDDSSDEVGCWGCDTHTTG